jgi:phosphoadenosine phosphosulfate reductase
MTTDELNRRYKPLTPEQRIGEVYKDFSRVLFTSSFGTSAVFLLHLFHRVRPHEMVYFLDTTYHFAETLEYKSKLTKLFNLNVTDIMPEEWKNKFTRDDQTWHKDPDLCCSINKVEPLEKVKANYEVWVSGLMAFQNSHRSNLNIFEQKRDIIKFYPVIDVEESDLNNYLEVHNLPVHPLKTAGYHSVGCIHCTSRGKGREGRWSNRSKTECGLHL